MFWVINIKTLGDYLHNTHSFQISLPEHVTVLQFTVSMESPVQSAPLGSVLGAGFVHVLVRVFDPVPQVLVHSPYVPHSDHAPSVTCDGTVKHFQSVRSNINNEADIV